MEKENLIAGLQRLAAFAIDLIVLGILYGLVYLIADNDLMLMLESGTGSYVIMTFTVFVIPSVYFILMWHLTGATVGMFALNLRLVELETGKKPLLFIALWRYVVFYISWFSLFIGFLWVLWDSRCQSWADKLSGTVIKKRKVEVRRASEEDVKLWKKGIVLFYVALSLMLIVNLIWQYEKPLSKEAEKALFDFAEDPYPHNNGFYELACFGADENVDALEEGIAAVERLNNSTMEIYKASGFWGKKYDVEPQNIYYNSLDNSLVTLQTFVESGDYMGEVQNNAELITSSMEKYKYLEERYDRVLDYEYYRSPVFPDIFVSIPIYLPLVQYQRLYCADIALEYMNGSREEAIERLAHSFAVTERLMEDTDMLITKLVSVILYKFNMITCTELINYEKDIDPLLADFVLDLEPLSKSAMSFKKAIDGEFTIGASFIIRLIDSPKGLLDRKIDLEDVKKANPPFIKANQILNHTYELFDQLVKMSEMPFYEFNKEAEVPIDLEMDFIDYLNNPIGSILSKNYASVVYTSYVVMVKDCQLNQNMLKAAAAIKLNKINRDDIASFLNRNSLRWGNLYTNKAFGWNEEEGSLNYEGPLQEDRAEERKMKLNY